MQPPRADCGHRAPAMNPRLAAADFIAMRRQRDDNFVEYGTSTRGHAFTIASFVAILVQIPWIALAELVAISFCGKQSAKPTVVFVGAFACVPAGASLISGLTALIKMEAQKPWQKVALLLAMSVAVGWIAFVSLTLFNAKYIDCP